MEPKESFAHDSPVASVGTVLRLLVTRHERRDHCVEVVRRCLDTRITLDHFERID